MNFNCPTVTVGKIFHFTLFNNKNVGISLLQYSMKATMAVLSDKCFLMNK